MQLLKLIRDEARLDTRTVLALSVMSAVSTTLVLVVVNSAAEQAGNGEVDLRLLLLMALATLGFAWSQRLANLLTAREIERVLHDMRLRLFGSARNARPDTLSAVGQGALQSALTQEMQGISNTLPMILLGVQQLVMLVFVSLYMAWMSLIAFLLTMAFSVLATLLHVQRMHEVLDKNRRAREEEGRLFDGLTDLLHGFKEVRMSRARETALIDALDGYSAEARIAKSAIRRQWALELALVQLAFYLIMALMVFVVPLFTTDFHDMAVQATTAALFMIGPIGAILQTIPALGEANTSLQRIATLEQRLQARLNQDGSASNEAMQALEGASPLHEIALNGLRFAYPDGSGSQGFAIGPLEACFRAGEISFITGGNGSGKSTLISLLTGLRPPDEGCITVNQAPVRHEQLQAYRDQFATVLADYHLFRELHGLDTPDPERVRTLLKTMEIDHKVTLEGHAFSTLDLSQGQRKRVALIAALLENKPVLVLDEWAADQDPHFRTVFYEQLLPELKAQGKIIICVTHDDRWFHQADRLYQMRDGRLACLRG